LVERLRQAGVLPIGKTNTSEFGMGSNTYNGVYGTTRNPYDPTQCAGGSSGGAAAGVACGMLPGADGGGRISVNIRQPHGCRSRRSTTRHRHCSWFWEHCFSPGRYGIERADLG